ncbi:CoA pyrophosphatase [Halomonas sp. CnH100-B]|jgi:8-oxo-dGTP pyrophosphatase MutT (NUDIX family)|uniref:CoA pyrophosphatase n=1 Tax=Vreelandella aquamarina TaxID=77097 RepID=A0A857GIL1_9GAMM|nr:MULTISPECIES: CoA pyrophosphatase [Halomonas]MAO61368.1 CoA pyrophosphatase [Halomonas sp.]MCO7228610.1 CoA pyrophosphatase [Halomonas sp. CnH100-B]MDP4558711.1 CoA pyrophosphatase [Halomonas meridiana]QHD49098.1 CoA pyrophosphatase [Halomonas meridiana]HAZ98654.1 CoA pyrophosphatase [Halomonas sp.]|tara:strand:+ start:1424 stop:2095 length:672 start_codon:yes stop_codon:yes gene_type:complete
MLEKLRKRLQQHTPQRLDHVALPEAAVLMPIVERPAPTLLFTRRASHLNTHRGQVAFPGGKREPGDADLYATALREAEEEIALAPGLVQPLGRLSDVISLHGIRVTPWVGIIPPDLPLVADPAELDAIFEVPLSHFLDDQRTHTDVITVDGVAHYVPSYHVDGHVIWGLSAMMLVELLAEGFGMEIDLYQRPPGALRHYPERRTPTSRRSANAERAPVTRTTK